MSISIEKDDKGNKYVAIPIGKIEPEKVLDTAIYLKVDGKFLRFKHAGDYVEDEKFNFFIQKNLKNIYVLEGEHEAFLEWISEKRKEVIDEIVAEVGEEHREIVVKSEGLREKVYDTFTEVEMDSGIVEILQEQVSEFINEVKEVELSKAILTKMLRHNASTADHALNVANVALFMSMVLGHGNYQVLEDIYLGAIFHDYYKMKIPPEVLANKQNFQYKQAMEDHPKKSGAALRKLEGIREEVVKIIEQHHENHNGNGYPEQLKGDEIFGLAKIISMANIFDNIVVENHKKPKKDQYRAAIKVLEYDKGKQFDPDLVDKVLTPLKLAYGDYYISPTGESS
jgi:putative nucleotidyltransferase with HDIG domain